MTGAASDGLVHPAVATDAKTNAEIEQKYKKNKQTNKAKAHRNKVVH